MRVFKGIVVGLTAVICLIIVGSTALLAVATYEEDLEDLDYDEWW